MNSTNFIGNICNDLELKQTNSGKSVCSFNLAVKRPFSKDVTDFLPIVAWNKQAENLCTYCGKGSRIAVSGIATSRPYQDKDGNNRTAFEIIANEVIFLEKKADGQSNTQDASPLPSPDGFFAVDDDSLPF